MAEPLAVDVYVSGRGRSETVRVALPPGVWPCPLAEGQRVTLCGRACRVYDPAAGLENTARGLARRVRLAPVVAGEFPAVWVKAVRETYGAGRYR